MRSFVFYAPAWVLNICHILYHKVDNKVDITAKVIIMMNHANNPVIYGLMNGNFRKAVLELFIRKKVDSCWIFSTK